MKKNCLKEKIEKWIDELDEEISWGKGSDYAEYEAKPLRRKLKAVLRSCK